MAQCKATTASGTQCVSETAPPSRTLCKRHSTMLASGKAVTNFGTGRTMAAPVAAAPAPRGASSTATRKPRVATAAVVASLEDAADEPRAARAAGERPLTCDGPACKSMALPGSNYCMKHQSLA